jgi:hypothetical protein
VRRSVVYILIAIAALAIIAGAALAIRDRNRPVIRTSASPQDIEAVLTHGIDEVSTTISGIFAAAKADSSSSKFANFEVHPASDPIFPDDYQLRYASAGNPGLARYVSIDPAARRWDFYLTPPPVGPPDSSGNTDYYWESEYQYQGLPVKFRCNFIIHLEPRAESATKISILESQPEIWIGKKFDALGHGGPGLYRDVRLVEPTNIDRAELLDFIKGRLASGNPIPD